MRINILHSSVHLNSVEYRKIRLNALSSEIRPNKKKERKNYINLVSLITGFERALSSQFGDGKDIFRSRHPQ